MLKFLDRHAITIALATIWLNGMVMGGALLTIIQHYTGAC